MKIGIASDHAGFEFKQRIQRLLLDGGHALTDFGTHDTESVDYPDVGIPAAEAVSKGQLDRAVLICASGIGMSIVANKIPGVRAALCHDLFTATASRQHNDANVLVLGQRVVPAEAVAEIVNVWIETPFEGGRHQRRLSKIGAVEQRLKSK